MSELDHGIKIIKTITFNGKKTSFRMWSRIFQAKMDLQVHGHIFGEKTTIPSHDSRDIETDMELFKLFNSNKVVYSELMFAIQYEICFTIIDNVRTEFFPDSDSILAWKKLNLKFQSNTNNNLCQLKYEFQNTKLGKNKDPDVFINRLEKLNIQLNNQLD